MYKTGDKVYINSCGFYLGKGIVTSFTKGNVRLANVETFDGVRYSVSESDLTKIKE